MSAAARALLPLWRGHVNALGCFDAQLSQRSFDELCAAYSRPHRAYHTLDHLVQLFALLETHGQALRDPLRLAFATWYHDIVYDPAAKDNEERSADVARAAMGRLCPDAHFVERVAQLILATKSHAKSAGDAEGDLFLDSDYAILGATPDAYATYAKQVRREYAHLTDAQWRNGRSAFLRAAAAEPRTFRTDIFESAYGDAARANMRRELETLVQT